MKITVKTLEGQQFDVEIQESSNIEELKRQIEIARPDFVSSQQKLIFKGKVLADDQTVADAGLQEKTFIVCMVKPAKRAATPAAAAPAPAPAVAPAPAPFAAPAPVLTSAPVLGAAAVPAPAVVTSSGAAQYERAEDITRLKELGFPEPEVRAALRAAMGNPDVAVEYLFSGIPEQTQIGTSSGSASAAPAGATGADRLQALRAHPQFNQLRQLVQANPTALQQVLQQIGQQNPELLAVIHANQEAFLEMMNEPVTEAELTGAAARARGGAAAGGSPALNAAQFAQMLESVPPAQRAQLAQAMGMSPEQLNSFAQMMASMPPEQMQQLLAGMGGMGGPAAGGARPNVVRLTEDEMAAVQRLVELGFDQNDAVQAFLACDRNEALAANLLMDGWNADADGQGAGAGAGAHGSSGGDDEYS